MVTGPDRKSWLNGILTCDVATLTEAQGVFGLVLTKQGKIVSDVLLVERGEAVYVSVAAGRAPMLHETLDRLLIMEDAELHERSAELCWLTLHGPRAAELLSALDVELYIAGGAIDATGLGGAVLVAPRERQSEVAALLASLGAVVAKESDWQKLRIERGLPTFGVDYDERDNPHEASLDRRAVSWTKGCYLGQEVVCMQDMRGKVKRRIVPLSIEGGQIPEPGTAVEADGERVGEVTSAALSFVLERPVALARLRAAFAEGCAALSVGGQGAVVLSPAP
jgi:hypothetical protein